MVEIIRGTTPTITYTFDTVEVSNLLTAYLTIKRKGEVLIELDFSHATIGDNSLSWKLSQEDTLAVEGTAEIMLNWLSADGVRGASKVTQVEFTPNHKEQVI